MTRLAERAKAARPRVVFPEGEDDTIIEAARQIAAAGIARPLLIGNETKIVARGGSAMDIVDPAVSPRCGAYAAAYARQEDFPEDAAAHMLRHPVNFAAAMAGAGDADAMVAGFAYGTAQVILSSRMFIGMREGAQTASSFFVMDVPSWSGGEDGLVVFADCAVNPNPTADELADIAIATATSVRELLGWDPRVAMLSFSTRGSSTHPDVDKVLEALRIVRERQPDLSVDGEMQADTALDEHVAKKKMGEAGSVAGRANILIFPDLDAGNIGYKLVQRLARAAAFGPLFQGFRRPVSDLSKGASIEDIVGATTLAAAWAAA